MGSLTLRRGWTRRVLATLALGLAAGGWLASRQPSGLLPQVLSFASAAALVAALLRPITWGATSGARAGLLLYVSPFLGGIPCAVAAELHAWWVIWILVPALAAALVVHETVLVVRVEAGALVKRRLIGDVRIARDQLASLAYEGLRVEIQGRFGGSWTEHDARMALRASGGSRIAIDTVNYARAHAAIPMLLGDLLRVLHERLLGTVWDGGTAAFGPIEMTASTLSFPRWSRLPFGGWMVLPAIILGFPMLLVSGGIDEVSTREATVSMLEASIPLAAAILGFVAWNLYARIRRVTVPIVDATVRVAGGYVEVHARQRRYKLRLWDVPNALVLADVLASVVSGGRA